ncbi:MAG: EamA family transporter [Candidatus Paceibacterota bacterium]
MSLYLIGVFAAFVAVFFHAWSNIFDNFFSGVVFKNLTVLQFFSALTELVFIPIVLIFDFPKIVSLELFGLIAILALMDVLYTYPYYWALKRMDTSVITSLFSIGKIFVPLFAFFVAGERLLSLQYVGFFLVIISSVFLTLDIKKLRFDKALFFMLLVSLILTAQGVLYKYVFNQGASWGTVVVWMALYHLIFIAVPMLAKSNRKDLKGSVQLLKGRKGLFFLNQFLGWGGEAVYMLAIFLIPVSVVKGITSTQSIFVLLFAVFFAKNGNAVFHEQIRKETIWKKAALLVFIVIGAILITVV